MGRPISEYIYKRFLLLLLSYHSARYTANYIFFIHFRKKNEIENQQTENNLPWILLFHGTSCRRSVQSICAQGFDHRRRGANGARFGEGTYFGGTAKISHDYTKSSGDAEQLRYMFFARVAIGQITVGRSEYQRPPLLKRHQPELGRYDTCVNDLEDPAIFVTFDDNQTYPEYVIEYYSRTERYNYN